MTQADGPDLSRDGRAQRGRTRPTYLDLARSAGVSKATVDRVMNGRDGVRAQTRDLVQREWRRLQGEDVAPAADAATVPDRAAAPLRMDFVIPRGESGFLTALIAGIGAEAGRRDDIEVRLHRSAAIEEVDYGSNPLLVPDDSDGVAILASEHPSYRHAIALLMRRGIPVVTLASDVLGVEKTGYVGIDNLGSGRLAGYLIRRLTGAGAADCGGAATVAIGAIRGHSTLRGQYEREFGLRQIVQETPGLTIAGIVEAAFDATREATLRLLADHPDIRAIYNMTAGNRGVVAALVEAGLVGKVLFIGHDLTAYTQEALLSGQMDFVIDQSPGRMAHEAISILLDARQGRAVASAPMPIGLFCVENLGRLQP